MRNSTIALAIAGVLASAAASAANLDVYITGASAQRNFWVKDLVNICGVAGSAVTEFDGNEDQSPNPDYKAWTCTGSATAISPVHAGDVVTLHYSAELGSEWGIAPGLGNAGVAGYPTTHLFLTNTSTSTCTFKDATSGVISGSSVYNCPGTKTGTVYSYQTDSVSGPGLSFFAQHKPDIVAADVEPTKWALADNWAGPGGAGLNGGTVFATALGNAPSFASLSTLQAKGSNIAGQIFGVILTNGTGAGAAVPGNVTNLSRQSIQSIFQGVYTTWNQVPEVGAADTVGTNIVVCRRDHGSGSQTAASIFATQTECGATNSGPFVSIANPNLVNTVVENNTGSLVASCVTGNNAAIGFATLAPSSTYNTISVDGVAANAHNSAAGYYGFAYETWAWNVTGNALAAKFLSRASNSANLASVLGGETVKLQANSQFTVTSGNAVSYYGLAANNGSTNTVAGLTNGATTTTAATGIPTEIFAKNGESCAVVGNTNSN